MKRPHLIPCLVAIGLLFGAVFGHWPYDYYTLLRFVVCGVSAYVAYLYMNQEHEIGMWGFGAVALLFNPIIKIHLSKGTWGIIDLIVAGIFLVPIFKLKITKT